MNGELCRREDLPEKPRQSFVAVRIRCVRIILVVGNWKMIFTGAHGRRRAGNGQSNSQRTARSSRAAPEVSNKL